MMIALRNLFVSVVQVPKLVEVFIIFFVSIAITMMRFATSLRVRSPLSSLLVVDESSRSAPVPMLYRAHNEAIARKFGAQAAVCGSRAPKTMTEDQQREGWFFAHALGRIALLVFNLITVLLHVAFWGPMSRRRGVPIAA
jgi:hypothetical protein